MRINSLLGAVIIWALLGSIGYCVSKRLNKITHDPQHDVISADELQARYPGLDLEDTCKQAKNPKCEALIDDFCIKSCNPYLCGEYGSIRGMCRLMCEAEELPNECTKMGSSKLEPLPVFNPFQQPDLNQQIGPFNYGFPQ